MGECLHTLVFTPQEHTVHVASLRMAVAACLPSSSICSRSSSAS